MKQDYPKWLYSVGRSLIVDSKEAHEALDGVWHESPADVVPESDIPVKVDGRKTRHNKEA